MIAYTLHLADFFRGVADAIHPPQPQNTIACGDRLTVLIRHRDGSVTTAAGRVNVLQGRAGSQKIHYLALEES